MIKTGEAQRHNCVSTMMLLPYSSLVFINQISYVDADTNDGKYKSRPARRTDRLSLVRMQAKQEDLFFDRQKDRRDHDDEHNALPYFPFTTTMSTTSNNNNNNNNNQSTTSSSSTASHQQAAHRQKIQEQFNHHVKNFVVDLEFPAQVKNAKHQDNHNNNDSPSSLRTSPDIVQHRLLESGVLFTNTQTVGELTDRIADFVQNMERSGCFHAVQVKIGGTADDDHHRNHHHTRESSSSADGKFPPPPPERLQVILNERNWYRLYIGGGLKQDGLLSLNSTSTSDSTLLVPKVQLEASGKLLNLTGNLDVTSLQYTIDQTSCACLSFLHERPLFSFLPDEPGGLRSSLLESSNGSQISLAFRAHLDTVDHEWTRSYKEYQRLLGIRIANSCNVTHPEMVRMMMACMIVTSINRTV
jgi:hypothetical protein